uniref:Major facilitator superfamily (MFS) profile domain-containing protein n=2 Tax=Clytia hemisphaerica TaxID=252671 RepID=A0A7M5XCX8_9CNID
MVLMDGKNHESWLQKRRKTFVAYLIETCALGMEYSLTFITLWMYLKDVIQTDDLNLFYSSISVIYLISQVAMSVLFGALFDHHRNARLMILIGNLCIISGNILYTIPYSPWYLFTGRLISGGGGCLRSIMTAEIVRAYPKSELSGKFSSIGLSFALGFVFGPLLNIPFANENFSLFGFPISYANAPGLVLSVIFMVIQLLDFYLVSNLSLEYDMKEFGDGDSGSQYSIIGNDGGGDGGGVDGGGESQYSIIGDDGYEKSQIKDDLDSSSRLLPFTIGDEDSDDQPRYQWYIFFKMIHNVQICFILFLSLFFMYCMVLFDLWLPMTATEYLQYGVTEINYVILGFGACAVVQLIVFTFRPIPQHLLIYFAMFCIFGMMLDYAIFVVLRHFHGNHTVNIVLLAIWDFLAANIIAMEEIFLIVTLATKVGSRVQTTTESIRLACSRTGAILALTSAASAFSWITITCSICISLLFISLIFLIVMHKRLSEERVLVR